ncbi:peroxiredoxin [Mucilaginibacter gracilis]|uniref:Peroxiredoxin n=1 Tax=Mucilaginibacter gracilis TaxID=423350 RepID=A0A495J8S4_9SPHI|nr:TlpA disulfide reductase family protein [Mucilaginibacter gracilis]RKR84862.1 peroxiredoxin [Mucilaginibacter gracilis]
MKKIASTVLLLLPAAAIFAQQGGAFTVKGSVNKATGQEKAFLLYNNGTTNVTDSATVVNGAFEFKGTVASPVKATLVLAHKGETFEVIRHTRKVDVTRFYAEPATIVLSAADSVAKTTVTGGANNKDNELLTAATKPFADQSQKVEAEENAVPKEKQTPELQKEYEKKYNAIDAEKKKVVAAFIKAHPKSWVSLNALQDVGGYYPEASDLEPVYNILSDELKTSTQGKYYATLIPKLKLVAIGAKAPVFAQNDKDGKAISVESFKGKYLLIDFWASWCGPCRAENPNVVKAYNQFKDKNFTILGVSLDQPTGREKWLAAIEKDGLAWTQVTDLKYWGNEAAALYGVRAIPQNFLLDPEGKIIAKNLEGTDLTNKLTEIFSGKTAVKAPAGTGK